ncbi:MAG: hypothetical protein JWO59_1436, partial [Chloroflexi bacterium]|nr:hypothetical protein [Chloroflexota bacterium]
FVAYVAQPSRNGAEPHSVIVCARERDETEIVESPPKPVDYAFYK